MHIDVVSDFVVFRPVVGALIQGMVVKKSPSHVSVLTHSSFNVTCYVPKDDDGDWCGRKVKPNQLVRFTVLKTDLAQRIPFIMAALRVIDFLIGL